MVPVGPAVPDSSFAIRGRRCPAQPDLRGHRLRRAADQLLDHLFDRDALALGGEGLGAAWGKQKVLQMLGEAGFTQVTVKRIESNLFNNYYIAAKQST